MLKKFFLAAALSLAALAPALFSPQPAEAANERGIALTAWECLLCDKTYYTFKPDSLDCTKGETRTRQYQASNWNIFKGKRMMPVCPKADGAHIFKKSGEILTDPISIVKNLEWIVYTRNSGGSLQATLVRMKCMGCSMEAYAFSCDDLDYEKPIDLKKPNTWMLMDGQRVRSCNWQPAWSNGSSSQYHFMKDLGNSSISSRELANNMNKVICSQPN